MDFSHLSASAVITVFFSLPFFSPLVSPCSLVSSVVKGLVSSTLPVIFHLSLPLKALPTPSLGSPNQAEGHNP